MASRRHLHSASLCLDGISSDGRQAFAVAGPTAWNSLSDDLRNPTLDSFRRLLLTTWLFSVFRVLVDGAEVSHFMRCSRLTA